MPLTRHDAHLIAEEFYKLCEKNKIFPEEYIGIDEAAKMLCLSPKTVYNNISRYPHTKVDGTLRFSRRRLQNYIERK